MGRSHLEQETTITYNVGEADSVVWSANPGRNWCFLPGITKSGSGIKARMPFFGLEPSVHSPFFPGEGIVHTRG